MEEVFDCVRESDKQRFGLLYTPTRTEGEVDGEASGVEGREKGQVGEVGVRDPTEVALGVFAKEGGEGVCDVDPTHFFMRATQGHSMKCVAADELLTSITLDGVESIPETVVHGTFYGAWEAIVKDGFLRRMGRNHVHFSSGPKLDAVLEAERDCGGAVDGSGKGRLSKLMQEGKVVSGMRRDAEVLIYIDIRKAMKEEDGMKWWRSENGVVLTEGMGKEGRVESKWWTKVVEVREGSGVLWEDGKLAKELPTELKSRSGLAGKRGGGAGRGGRGGAKPKLMVERDDVG